MKRFAFAALFAVAVMAFTAYAGDDKTENHDLKEWFQAGVYIGPKGANRPVGSTANRLNRLYFASRDFNFDAGQAGDVRAGPAVSKTGVRVGDVCVVTPDRVALGTGDLVYCDVMTNNSINFWLVTTKTDNNAGDAGFRFMVISNQ